MRLFLNRPPALMTAEATLGEIFMYDKMTYDGGLQAQSLWLNLITGIERECFTLELPNKDGLPGSCIPGGRTYPVQLMESDEFGEDEQFVELCRSLGVRVLIPRIGMIPNRSLIDIHWGNTRANTKGCICVGETQDAAKDFIGASRLAFAKLYPQIVRATKQEGCWISVIGGATV